MDHRRSLDYGTGPDSLPSLTAMRPWVSILRGYWLTAAAFSELVGGVLVLLGLLTRLGAFAIMCVMSVAILGIHWGSFFQQNHGMEFALSMFGVALSLLITGGGRASADQMISRR